MDRHLTDSLEYARFLPRNACLVMDIGSGAGLPGIPLAIALPDVRFVLSDRSARRVDLLERAVRVIGLENAEVVRRDLHSLDGEVELAVARAVLQPAQWLDVALKALIPGGILVVGVGHGSETPQSSTGVLVERHDFESGVLDRSATILTIQKCDG